MAYRDLLVGGRYQVRLAISHLACITFESTLRSVDMEDNGVTPRLYFDNGVVVTSDLVELRYITDPTLNKSEAEVAEEVTVESLKCVQWITFALFLGSLYMGWYVSTAVFAAMSVSAGIFRRVM